MNDTPLTKEQLKKLLKDVEHVEIMQDVFRIEFQNRVIVHLTANELILGYWKVYPDTTAKQCVYVGDPPWWVKDTLNCDMTNCKSDGLFETAKYVLAQKEPNDLNFIYQYNKNIDVQMLASLVLEDKHRRDESPKRK